MRSKWMKGVPVRILAGDKIQQDLIGMVGIVQYDQYDPDEKKFVVQVHVGGGLTFFWEDELQVITAG